MTNKGFTDQIPNIETQKDTSISEKPLKYNSTNSNRVDINVLKSKLQESENKEFKKNLLLLSVLIFVLGFLGIYLSL